MNNKIFSTKEIENKKYEISRLKGLVSEEREKNKLIYADNLILYSKWLSRVYLGGEVALFFVRKSGSNFIKIFFIYLRYNIVWLSTNFLVNKYMKDYLEIDKIILKYKKRNEDVSDFRKFIEHK